MMGQCASDAKKHIVFKNENYTQKFACSKCRFSEMNGKICFLFFLKCATFFCCVCVRPVQDAQVNLLMSWVVILMCLVV